MWQVAAAKCILLAGVPAGRMVGRGRGKGVVVCWGGGGGRCRGVAALSVNSLSAAAIKH